jgi:hypothetical protein
MSRLGKEMGDPQRRVDAIACERRPQGRPDPSNDLGLTFSAFTALGWR